MTVAESQIESVTRADLALLRADIRADLEKLRGDTRTDLEKLRTVMADRERRLVLWAIGVALGAVSAGVAAITLLLRLLPPT